MRYRNIDTTREKRSDFKGRQVEYRERTVQDWRNTGQEYGGSYWSNAYEYREVLSDEPELQWITDRLPTEADGCAWPANNSCRVWKKYSDGTIRPVGVFCLGHGEPWCRIILPADPPVSAEDRAKAESWNCIIHSTESHACHDYGFDAGVRFARKEAA